MTASKHATGIEKHEGSKYLRKIYPATVARDPESGNLVDASIMVDVYCVLVAFEVECPATAHAVKKLLCAGQRGKGSRLTDLVGALAALNRAIELEETHGGQEPTQERTPASKLAITIPPVPARWVAVPAIDNAGKLYGYKVRWSEPNDHGEYHWAGHYHAGQDGDPSLNWCAVAAENDAKRKNDEKKIPWLT